MPNIRRTEKPVSVWLDQVQVAELVGVSHSSIRRWCEARKFPQPHRYGLRTFRWRRSEIEAFIEQSGPKNQ